MWILKFKSRLSQLHFSLQSIVTTITSNATWDMETNKTDQDKSITNHKPWPFEPVEENYCFLRVPLRWLTPSKNAKVSWLLNFRISVILKSAVNSLWNGTRKLGTYMLYYSHNNVCLQKRVKQVHTWTTDCEWSVTMTNLSRAAKSGTLRLSPLHIRSCKILKPPRLPNLFTRSTSHPCKNSETLIHVTQSILSALLLAHQCH